MYQRGGRLVSHVTWHQPATHEGSRHTASVRKAPGVYSCHCPSRSYTRETSCPCYCRRRTAPPSPRQPAGNHGSQHISIATISMTAHYVKLELLMNNLPVSSIPCCYLEAGWGQGYSYYRLDIDTCVAQLPSNIVDFKLRYTPILLIMSVNWRAILTCHPSVHQWAPGKVACFVGSFAIWTCCNPRILWPTVLAGNSLVGTRNCNKHDYVLLTNRLSIIICIVTA